MKKDYIDSELYETLHFTPDITSEVRNKIDTAYEQIRKNSSNVKSYTNHHPSQYSFTINQKTQKRAGFYMGLAAAIILSLGFIGFSNPVMAGKLPFIGRIFNLIESKVGYPGDFSEHSITITAPDALTENDESIQGNTGENAPDGYIQTGSDSSKEDGAYSQTANGVTITLSEASYTEMALYYSLELYCEEGFPEDFNRVKNMEDYISSYDILYMQTTQSFDFTQADPSLYPAELISSSIGGDLPTPYSIEGNFVDSNTFLGIIRVDLSIICEILKVDALPTEFIYSFTINKFWGDLNEYEDIEITNPETGEVSTIKNAVHKRYEGPWSFSVPVALNQTPSQSIEIMETNSEGVGISSVTKTQYEIRADIILPESANPEDYFIAITDADGKILDSQGIYAEIYSVYGRNTDTVYVYVVDYSTYMDECKADNAYLLPEKALYQTKIEW